MNACAFECSGISFYPKAGLKVSLIPPQIDVPRVLTVKSFANDKITFEEVQDKTQMQQFDGMHLLVEEDVASTLEKPVGDEFVGWKIVDKTSNKSLKISSKYSPTSSVISFLLLKNEYIVTAPIILNANKFAIS